MKTQGLRRVSFHPAKKKKTGEGTVQKERGRDAGGERGETIGHVVSEKGGLREVEKFPREC